MWKMWLSKVNAQGDASRCSVQRTTRSPTCLEQKLGRVHKKDQANPNESQRRLQEGDSRRNSSGWVDKVARVKYREYSSTDKTDK